MRPGTNPIYGYILSGMGILVLSVACLNYVLLYVARFNSRTKELGIRQILARTAGNSDTSYWSNVLDTAFWPAS